MPSNDRHATWRVRRREFLAFGVGIAAGGLPVPASGQPKAGGVMGLEQVPAAAPLHAWRVPTGSFPVSGDRRTELLGLVRRLLKAAAPDEQAGAVAVLAPSATDASQELITANAGRWRLTPGYGIRPEQPAPTTPGVLDTMWAMLSRQRPPNTTLYRPGGRTSSDEVIEAAAGSGGLTILLCPDSVGETFASIERGLESYLTDPIARGKSFYVPVIGRGALQEPGTGVALGDALLYVREDPEEKEMLIVSPQPLEIPGAPDGA